MADHNSVTPQRRQPIPPSSNSCFPVTPSKTKQYASRGNSVVLATQVGHSMLPVYKITTFPNYPFKLKKELMASDVDGSNGLSLHGKWAKQYILQSMDLHDAEFSWTGRGAGKEFVVVDMNDGSLHYLVLKWKKNCFVLTGNWLSDFVIRKQLEAGDWIGIAFQNGCFFLKLLKKRGN